MKDYSLLAISMWTLLLVLMAWVYFSSRIKNDALKNRLTPALILLFLTLPVLLKIFLTDGFLNNIADQTFLVNYIQKYLHTHAFSDPLLKDVPPFYPPLFFYVTGKIGQLLHIDNIIVIYNIGCLTGFALSMGLLFNLLRKITQTVDNHSRWFYIVFFTALFFIFFDFDFLYGKCYEILSFLLMITVIYEIDGKGPGFSIAKTGVILGIIAMLYFYSLIIFSVAVLVYFFRTPEFKLSRFMALAGVSLLVASPYLYPLFKQFFLGLGKGGSTYLIIDLSIHAFYPYIPNLNTVQGIIVFFSSAGFFWTFKGKYRFLKMQFIVIYTLYFLNLFAIGFLSRDMLWTPRLWAWTKVLFYFTAMIFLKEFLVYLNNKFDPQYIRKVTWSLLTIFTIVAFNGYFNSLLFRNKLQETKVVSILNTNAPEGIYSFIDQSQPQVVSGFMTHGMREPFYFFLPNNLIYSNPFGDIGGRITYLKKLTGLRGQELYRAMRDTPYGPIHAIIGKEGKNGGIEFSTLTGNLISVQEPMTFEFQLSSFNDRYFRIKRVGEFTVIKLRDR